MSEPLTPERETEIREQAPGLAAAFTDWLNRYSPLYAGQQMADTVEAELKDVPALLAEIDRLRARVTELERPAVEAKRAEVRQSYMELSAQACEDRDYEGAFNVDCSLREREEQWAREDLAPDHP